jgi:hypothetical protein
MYFPPPLQAYAAADSSRFLVDGTVLLEFRECFKYSGSKSNEELLFGRSALLRFFSRKMAFFLGSAKSNKKWKRFGGGPACALQPRILSRKVQYFFQNFSKISKKMSKPPFCKKKRQEHLYVLGSMATCKSPWEFLGSTSHLHFL